MTAFDTQEPPPVAPAAPSRGDLNDPAYRQWFRQRADDYVQRYRQGVPDQEFENRWPGEAAFMRAGEHPAAQAGAGFTGKAGPEPVKRAASPTPSAPPAPSGGDETDLGQDFREPGAAPPKPVDPRLAAVHQIRSSITADPRLAAVHQIRQGLVGGAQGAPASSSAGAPAFDEAAWLAQHPVEAAKRKIESQQIVDQDAAMNQQVGPPSPVTPPDMGIRPTPAAQANPGFGSEFARQGAMALGHSFARPLVDERGLDVLANAEEGKHPEPTTAGKVGGFLGGMAGGFVPGEPMQNLMAVATFLRPITAGTAALGPEARPMIQRGVQALVDLVGSKLGPAGVAATEHALNGAGVGGTMEAVQHAGQEDWEKDPAGALGRTLQAAGLGAAKWGAIGGGMGAAGGAVQALRDRAAPAEPLATPSPSPGVETQEPPRAATIPPEPPVAGTAPEPSQPVPTPQEPPTAAVPTPPVEPAPAQVATNAPEPAAPRPEPLPEGVDGWSRGKLEKLAQERGVSTGGMGPSGILEALRQDAEPQPVEGGAALAAGENRLVDQPAPEGQGVDRGHGVADEVQNEQGAPPLVGQASQPQGDIAGLAGAGVGAAEPKPPEPPAPERDAGPTEPKVAPEVAQAAPEGSPPPRAAQGEPRLSADGVNGGEVDRPAAESVPPSAHDGEGTPPPETPPTPEPGPEKPPETTGIKNAVSAVERLRLNMGERDVPETRAMEEMYAVGKAAADKDPLAAGRLIDELRRDPEKIVSSDEEAGLLLKHKVDSENELHRLLKVADDARTSGDADGERVAQLQLAAHRESIKELTQLTERAGTAAGRALVSRKMMSSLDYSLSHMEAMSEVAKGAPLTSEELANVKRLHQEVQAKLADVEKQRDAANERAANAEADRQIEQLKREAVERAMPPAVEKAVKGFSDRLSKAADAARARIKARGIRLHAGLDPVELADYAIIGADYLGKGAAKVAEWSSRMVADFGDAIKPHLKQIFDAATERFNKESESLSTAARKAVRGARAPVDFVARMKDQIADGAKPAELRPYVRKVALDLIRKGVTDREALIDALHKEVQKAAPDITREQTRDILSGYGEFKPLDTDAAKGRLREVQTEAQRLAQLEAIQKGEAPRATGFERQPPTAEARRLQKQVNEGKKRLGIGEDGPGRLKSALESLKTRTRNQISDLQTEIDTGERIVRGQRVKLSDAELESLRTQLAGLREEHAKVFPKAPISDEQRLASATAAAERNAKAWEQRLADARAGKFAGPEKRVMSSPELEVLRYKAQAAREQVKELRGLHDPSAKLDIQRQIAELDRHLKDGTVPDKPARKATPGDIADLRKQRDALRREVSQSDPSKRAKIQEQIAALEEHIKNGTSPAVKGQRAAPADIQALKDQRAELLKQAREGDAAYQARAQERANQSYRTRLAEREADYRDRIARGDFGPRPPRKSLTLDPESAKAKARVEAVKQEYAELNARFEKANRPLPRKVGDFINKWIRFSALSHPTVIAKLTGAAVIRTLSTPMEQVAGAAASKVLPRLAGMAPREGVPSISRAISAEAAAQARMWTDGIRGSGRMLTGKRTTLELLHGGEKLPPELADYMGRLHGALKNPTLENEYARSLTMRTDHAIRAGVDVTDPIQQMRLSNEAYQDAKRSIFLQDNKVVDAWNRGLATLESPNKETGKQTAAAWLATAARAELPIVKVPLNIVHETSQVLTGWLTGSARAAFAYAKGIENLKPIEADSIMRQIKKGSIGAAMLAIGYYKASQIGGYYQKDEKRAPGEPPVGDIGPVPHSFLHNPYAEALQFGATVRRVAEAKLLKKQPDPNGALSGLGAAALGLLDEVPFVRETTTAGKIMDPHQREDAVGYEVASKVVPGVVQWIAKQTDRGPTGPIQRQPKGVWQAIEADVPGLRQNVPVKVEKGSQPAKGPHFDPKLGHMVP